METLLKYLAMFESMQSREILNHYGQDSEDSLNASAKEHLGKHSREMMMSMYY